MADDPYMQDAKRRADHSYPDLQQIVSDFERPSLGDFARCGFILAIAGAVVVGFVYSLFWILT